MDFLIGILLVAVVILILYNFTSISLSNSPANSYVNNNGMQNYSISSMQQSMPQSNNIIGNRMNIPQPVVSNSSISVNGSASHNQPVYDYNKYFFI
jgi:hypothetical protein